MYTMYRFMCFMYMYGCTIACLLTGESGIFVRYHTDCINTTTATATATSSTKNNDLAESSVYLTAHNLLNRKHQFELYLPMNWRECIQYWEYNHNYSVGTDRSSTITNISSMDNNLKQNVNDTRSEMILNDNDNASNVKDNIILVELQMSYGNRIFPLDTLCL